MFQYNAIARWASVRFTARFLISARSALNAVDWNAGGAAGRNCEPDIISIGVTPPNVAPAGVPLLRHLSGPVCTLPSQGVVNLSALSRSTIAAPAARPASTP